jgi:hypothetical protein
VSRFHILSMFVGSDILTVVVKMNSVFLGYNAVCFGESRPTFGSNISPHYSELLLTVID